VSAPVGCDVQPCGAPLVSRTGVAERTTLLPVYAMGTEARVWTATASAAVYGGRTYPLPTAADRTAAAVSAVLPDHVATSSGRLASGQLASGRRRYAACGCPLLQETVARPASAGRV
jgi:hypothetical protein